MLKIISVFLLSILLFTTNLYAQVVTDGTLGGSIQTLSPSQNGFINIGANLGEKMGQNLFHSFSDFNIKQGKTANFTGPNSVNNIITRVTGGNGSSIDGTLRSDIQGANLYLLNPWGISFGSNARLDISGSFHASTADSVLFKDGKFSATQPQKSVLTVASPEAFGFLDNRLSSSISIDGSFLELKENQTLSLMADELRINNGTLFAPKGNMNLVATGIENCTLEINKSTLYAPSGRINLMTIALENAIPTSSEMLAKMSFEQKRTIKLLDTFPPMERAQKLSMYLQMSPSLSKFFNARPKDPFSGQPVDLANIDVSGKGGGHVFIRAGKFVMKSSSVFADNTQGDIDGKGIDIAVQGKISLTNSARITAGAMEELEDNTRGGNIIINAVKLELNGISPNVLGLVLSIPTPEILEKIYNVTKQKAIDLFEKLQAIAVEVNPAKVSFDTFLERIGEQDTKLLFGLYLNNIGTANYGPGKGGNISIETPTLTVNKGIIDATTGTNGNAGNIDIRAQDVMLQEVGMIRAATVKNKSGQEGVFGKAGTITINGFNGLPLKNLSLEKFSSISVGSISSADAGNMNIITKNLTLDRSALISYNRGIGNAGSIFLTTDFISSTNGSTIDTEAAFGINGRFILNDVVLSELMILPSEKLLPERDLSLNRCTLSTEELTSSFYIITRDTLPTSPTDLRTHLYFSP